MGKEFVMTKVWLDRDDDCIECDVEGYVHYTVERDYGSDADGNRGYKYEQTFIDEVTDIIVTNSNGAEFNPIGKDMDKAEEALVNSFFENN